MKVFGNWGSPFSKKVEFALKLKACWGCEDREKFVDKGKEQLKALENELTEKKFFGGETIGFVDLVGDFLDYWLLIIQEAVGLEALNEEEFPKLFPMES
ncbi:hypothetical protein FEM48_Zijuj11G0099500 [Ziziphus jujuba var. spinosa]|uniref:GST C-terminal domain-containing protein n=1 Tax=Ziziphus jujuba var. spinosa TaxID=714518 RepID=A0A978UIA2_ZIZJJ|nr:hypothetical protein FEM48_Zijuj11G0099500 [Ziziphus jujuba var. spinosa]